MRPPRLLALLMLLAALLAIGAWLFVRAEPGPADGATSSAPALESQKIPAATLETNAVALRQEERSTDPERPGEEIPLANSTRIHGRVVRGSAQIPVAGIEVCCTMITPPVRVETPFVIDDEGRRVFEFPKQLPEEPGLVCTSGADGSFEFQDLDRGALYMLTASGPGWLRLQPVLNVAPAEEERMLAVQRLYSARVLVADEDGKPPLGACEYLRYARVAGPGECESLPVAKQQAATSYKSFKQGRMSPALEPEVLESGCSFTFASDCDEARLGPFRVLVCCAGFERQDFEFWAYPLGSTADAAVFQLHRAAAVVGLLRVAQDCECEGRNCAHLLEGKVVLEPVDPGLKTLEFELTGLVREQLFENIPGGTWHVRVRAKSGGFSYPADEQPALEVVLGSGATLVHVPVAKLGAIRWKLRGPGDDLPREAVAIRGSDSETPASLWLSLVMRGVEAGPHEFAIDAKRVASLEGASGVTIGSVQRISVDVVAGETKSVVVHAP